MTEDDLCYNVGNLSSKRQSHFSLLRSQNQWKYSKVLSKVFADIEGKIVHMNSQDLNELGDFLDDRNLSPANPDDLSFSVASYRVTSYSQCEK